MLSNLLVTQLVAIGDLHPYSNQLRRHSKAQSQARAPYWQLWPGDAHIVDPSNMIVAGHLVNHARVWSAVKGDTRAGLAILVVRARLIDDDQTSGTGDEIAGAGKTLLDEFLVRELAKRAKVRRGQKRETR